MQYDMTRGVMQHGEVMVESLIRTIRGQRVILDAELARIYGVRTRRLNEQVRRNADRFPTDFMFQITHEEVADLKAQTATGSRDGMRSQFATASVQCSRSQFATLNPDSHAGMRSQTTTATDKRNVRFLPYAFTEHGAIMAANVLNSPQAVQMSVFVVRAFVRMRQMLSTPHDLAGRLAELEKKLTARLDGHEVAITEVLQQIMLLLNPPSAPVQPRKQVGFHVRETRAGYSTRRIGK